MAKRQTTSFAFKFPENESQWLAEETRAYDEGFSHPCGIDEVGRGCLAGPVVACALILPRGFYLPGVDDSKKIKPSVRAQLARVILKEARAVALGMVTASEIDETNILKASFKAMHIALAKLAPLPDLVLVDGHLKIPGLDLPQKTFVKGDGRVFSIAAASIVAKVVRDRLMAFYARQFPAYGFEKHKGYGTLDHRQVIAHVGPCHLHRLSFAGATAAPKSP